MKTNQCFFLFLLLNIILNNVTGQAIKIMLNLNDENRQGVVYHNEPIFISVNLYNANSFSDWNWNRKSDQWIGELKEKYKKGKITKAVYEEEIHKADSLHRIIKIDSIGSPANPWTDQLNFVVVTKKNGEAISLPATHFSLSQDRPVAVLDQHNYNYARFGISPVDVKKLNAAVYLVKVQLDTVTSNELELTVKESDIPLSLLHSEAMLLKFGRYYYYTSELQIALRYADHIIKAYPKSIAGWILHGETNIKMNLYSDALKDFKKALSEVKAQYPHSPEQPLYVQATIEWLKKQLSKD